MPRERRETSDTWRMTLKLLAGSLQLTDVCLPHGDVLMTKLAVNYKHEITR